MIARFTSHEQAVTLARCADMDDVHCVEAMLLANRRKMHSSTADLREIMTSSLQIEYCERYLLVCFMRTVHFHKT